MAGFNIDELSALLFNGTREDSINKSVSKNQTTIIYGTAITGSSNGLVTVRLDDAVYAEDDLEDDDYEYLSLSEDDDVDGIDEDEELIDEEDTEEDEDVIFWQWQDDEATEQEN